MIPDPTTTPDLAADDRVVRALARRLAGDPHLGDDAAQETWLRALQRAQAPGLFAEFGRGWLCVVAKNAVLQALRGRERRQRREDAVGRARAAETPAGDGLDGESRARLLAAVRELPPDHRTVVQMRFFDDRLPIDIADELGLPVETVRTRLKRALERLRAALVVQ